ncbi:MAG TPA: TMEM175 family protein [Propionibacteriaceae bacterium]|nr:TMEM175 family protein [Propionibacteriaceae bacterium]
MDRFPSADSKITIGHSGARSSTANHRSPVASADTALTLARWWTRRKRPDSLLISFLVIGAHWRLHHRMFRYVRVATTAIIRLNMYWLLLIVITPFTTRMLSVGQQNLLRFGVYAATQAIQFTIFAVIIVLILRGQPIPTGPDLQRLQGGLWQTIAMAIGFAISIPLYLGIGQPAFAVWAAVPILANLIEPILRGRHAKVA